MPEVQSFSRCIYEVTRIFHQLNRVDTHGAQQLSYLLLLPFFVSIFSKIIFEAQAEVILLEHEQGVITGAERPRIMQSTTTSGSYKRIHSTPLKSGNDLNIMLVVKTRENLESVKASVLRKCKRMPCFVMSDCRGNSRQT